MKCRNDKKNFDKQTVKQIDVLWRHKNAEGDISCSQDTKSWNKNDAAGSPTGSLLAGVNNNVIPDDKGCITDKAYIVHNFT